MAPQLSEKMAVVIHFIYEKNTKNLILISSLSKAFGSHGGSASFSNKEAASFIKNMRLTIFSVVHLLSQE